MVVVVGQEVRAKALSYVGEFLLLRVMKTGFNNTVHKTHIII